jgi:FKBP-type peptidyl-prolyl cis-trans isomerase
MKFILIFLCLSFLCSCNFSGIKQNDEDTNELANSTNSDVEFNPVVEDSLVLEHGIVIKYFNRGNGDAIRKGDVVMIDYANKLEDGKVFDTNKKIGKPIPFIVGWLMQTRGWDLAFEYLRVGDHVEIYIPSKYARGSTGIKGLVPPDADNWLDVKIVSKRQADMNIDGVEVFIFEREKGAKKVNVGDELDLDYIAYSETKPRYSSSYANGAPFQFKVGSGSNLPGLNMAIENACYDDMLWVLIPPKHAFGSKGSVGNVKPNEAVLFDLLISERIE